MTDQIKIIKESAQKQLPGSDVIFFGSRARGNHQPDADFDLLIVTESEFSPQQKFPLRASIRKQLLAFGIFSDILIQSRAEIKRKKELPGHIVRMILKEGVRL